ncbi:MAG: branched-chain amino acid ABC transporter permease, partial [Candidatus Bipolaricaulia bacterium]
MAEIVLFSLSISALYALVAIGFTMIFGVGGVLNLAHGALIMAAAYTAFAARVYLHWSLYLSAALAVVIATLLALALYGGLTRYARLIFVLVAAHSGYWLGHSQLHLGLAPAAALALLTGAVIGLITYRYRRLLPYALWALIAALLWYLFGPLWGLKLYLALPLALLLTALFALGRRQGWIKRDEHGIFLISLPYLAYVAAGVFHLAPGMAFALAFAFAVLFTTGLVRYIQGSTIITMIVTLAFALALEQLVKILFGSTPGILLPLIKGNTLIFGVKLGNTQILAFAISWLAIGLLWFFVRGTRLGKATLATAQDRVGAALVGIDPELVYTVTWAISGALAGVAGVFFASSLAILPTMWRDPLVIAFAIVILGGLGSIRGSLIAAYFVGFLETLTVYMPNYTPQFIHFVERLLPSSLTSSSVFHFFSTALSSIGGPRWRGLPSLILLILILIL